MSSLRDQIAYALTDFFTQRMVVCEHTQLIEIGVAVDALLAVVQPALDGKGAEIERLRAELKGADADLHDALNHNDDTCEAVAERDRALAEWSEETKRLYDRIVQADAAIQRVRQAASRAHSTPLPIRDFVYAADILAALDQPEET